jgi:cytochrome c-type biogenesis protein CcmH
MIYLLALVFLGAALLAAAFVVVPALRGRRNDGLRASPWRAILAGALVLVVGLGIYGALGHPELALFALKREPEPGNYQQMVSILAQRIRERPNDIQGWSILGRGYLAFGEAEQAARAFRRAVTLSEATSGSVPAELLVDYALANAIAAGSVTAEVENILRQALNADPANPEARYYLGLAHADRGETAEALALWDGLVADAPPDAPWREALPLQIAALRGEAPGVSPEGEVGAPDIRAMVDGLAARLAQNPDDLDGWVMLVRAYAVLGEPENARGALATARDFFADDPMAMSALGQQATASGLE